MKTSDNDLKVNRNMYQDAVNLIDPKCYQLGPNSIFYVKSPNENINSFCLHKTGF